MIVALPRDRKQIWAPQEDGSLQTHSEPLVNKLARDTAVCEGIPGK